MGHMNVQYYMRIFMEASWHFFQDFGFDEAYFQRTNMGLFALEHHLRYFAEVSAGDEVSVFVRTIGLGKKRLHFMCFMVNVSNGKLASTFESIGTYVDMATRRSAPFSAEAIALIKPSLLSHQALDWKAPICGVMQI